MYIRSASLALVKAVPKIKWHIVLEEKTTICGQTFLFETQSATNVSKEDICLKCKR